MSRIESLLYNGLWIEKNYILLIGDEHKKLGFWGFWGDGRSCSTPNSGE
jgi:hypothetical protein